MSTLRQADKVPSRQRRHLEVRGRRVANLLRRGLLDDALELVKDLWVELEAIRREYPDDTDSDHEPLLEVGLNPFDPGLQIEVDHGVDNP